MFLSFKTYFYSSTCTTLIIWQFIKILTVTKQWNKVHWRRYLPKSKSWNIWYTFINRRGIRWQCEKIQNLSIGMNSVGKETKVVICYLKKFWETFWNFNMRYLLVVVRPTREVFTRMETSPLSAKGFKFWPMPGTHGHEALRVLSVPHLMWHGSSVYNGHLRGQMTLAPVTELLVGELSLPVFNDFGMYRSGSNPDLPHAKRTL